MNRITNILSKSLCIEPNEIKMEMGPNDTEIWDSLKQLEIIKALEDEFKVSFEITEIFEIMSIGDIYKILKRKGINDET